MKITGKPSPWQLGSHVLHLLMAPDCWKKCQSALGRIKDLLKPRIALKWTDLHQELVLKTKNNIFSVRRKERLQKYKFLHYLVEKAQLFLPKSLFLIHCSISLHPKFPKFIFWPHDEPDLICLFFSLPPQQMAVVIFKYRRYFVNYSWGNTLQNCFKALQFFHVQLKALIWAIW